MQLKAGETFTDVAPGKTVTSQRLNNHVSHAQVLAGAITEQPELVVTAVGDYVAVADVSDDQTETPKKVKLQNLLPETVRQGVQQYAAGVLAGGVYAVTLSPAATAYTQGMVVRFKADLANTGAVAVNVNELGNQSVCGPSGSALQAGDVQAGQVVTVVYDGTQFQMSEATAPNSVSPTDLTESARNGTPQYAAGVLGGTTYAVTLAPAATAYAAGMVLRFKASATNAGAVTVNVNGLGNQSLTARGGAALVAGQIAAGQLVTAVYDGAQFQVESIRPVYVGTAAGTLATGLQQFAHGMGAVPARVRAVLVCVGAQGPWVVGDELELQWAFDNGSGNQQFAVWANGVNVNVVCYNAGVRAVSATGAFTNLTAANWKVKVYAEL